MLNIKKNHFSVQFLTFSAYDFPLQAAQPMAFSVFFHKHETNGL